MSFDARSLSPPPNYAQLTSTSTLTPYLQLPHLLSLTWLAYPVLSLLFIAFRLLLSISSSQDAIASAKDDLLASCQAAERAATSAASMPRYLAIATNSQIVDAVNGTMNDARAALVLALTVMETIINFLVDIYRSTFLCFLELVVQGGLSLLISAVQDISSAITSTLNSIRTGIQSDVSSANSAISKIVDEVNKINPFGNISAPQLSIPSLSSLENVTIPTGFEDALINLNNSLPTVSSLKQTINAFLDTPFEALKADINDTFIGLSFNSSLLPVPEVNTVTFCDNLDISVVDDLGQDLVNATKIGIVIIVVAALLIIAGNCVLEWYKWRCLKRHLEYTRQAWTSDPTMHYTGPAGAPTVSLTDHNLMMLQLDAQHPLLTRIANSFSSLFRMSHAQHTNFRWLLHYIFHPPALACFLIGAFGILSVELQLLAVKPLEAKYTAAANASVTDFSNSIATQINASMFNQSAAYANGVNGHIELIQQTVNDGLFGWVNGTTTTLNNSLNNFYDDIQNAVSTVFNGTILEDPISEFIKCIIGSKVDALEDALTFLHNNLNIDLPTMNQSALVLSPQSINEVTQPIATAALGSGDSNNDGLISKIVASYVSSLKKERIMFTIFLGLWLIVVIMGLSVIFWHSYGRTWRDKRKQRRWEAEQRGFPSPMEKVNVDQEKGVPESNPTSFFPIPSPENKPLSILKRFASSATSAGDRHQRMRAHHPLANLNPNFEKSWDSLHRDSMANLPLSPFADKPAKLIAKSRKSMQPERLVSTPRIVLDDAPPTAGTGWWSRMTGIWRKDDEPGTQEAATGAAYRPKKARRSRPNLTISTVNPYPLDIRPENTTEVKSSAIEPRSMWSASPTPRRTPHWDAAMAKLQQQQTPMSGSVAPLRINTHKTQPSVPVPIDVGSSLEDNSVMAQMQDNHAALAMPLYYGYVNNRDVNRLVPPLDTHKRAPSPSELPSAISPSSALSSAVSPVDIGDVKVSTGVKAPAMQYGKTESPPRHKSMTVNPFETPFDDENQIVEVPKMSKYDNHYTNPFSGPGVAF